MEILSRARRLRTSEAVRELARETRISKTSLVYPMFVREGSGIKEEIPSLANQYHYSPDTICEGVKELVDAGVTKILLFGIPAHKDEIGSSAWQEDGAVQKAIGEIKKNFPQVTALPTCACASIPPMVIAVCCVSAPPLTTTKRWNCCAKQHFPTFVPERIWSLRRT